MKRLLPILLALLLLVGCAPDISHTPPQQSPIITAAPTPTPEPHVLDNSTPADQLGAFRYSNISLPLAGYEPTLYDLHGDILMLSIRYTNIGECNLLLYRMNSQTGEFTHSAAIPAQGFGTIQVHGDTVCLCSPPSGKVWFLDPTLQILQEFTFPTNYDDWYISPDLQHLYQLGWETGLHRYSLTDGTVTELLPDVSSPTIRDSDNNWVAFQYVDPNTQMSRDAHLYFDTGRIEPMAYDCSFMSMLRHDSLWLATLPNRGETYLLGQGGAPLYYIQSPNAFMTLTPRGQLLYRDHQSGLVSLYDQDGKFLSALQLPTGEYGPNGYLSSSMVWNEAKNGWYLLMTTFTTNPDPSQEPIETTSLMFWDLSVPVSGSDLTLTKFEFEQPAPGTAVAASLYERAAAIGEKYGVTIRIADQCDTLYDDFESELVTDPALISLGLDDTEAALSRYPDGFFRQLHYGSIREIEISLAGSLTPRRPDEYDGGVNAFAQPLYEKYIIVMDLHQTTEVNSHHEFSHMIDKRLQWDADHRNGAMFSEAAWAAMNPTGFDYDWTYSVYNSRSGSVNFDYFINSYAMTYPTEDRAQIWENAMMGYYWNFTPKPLEEKLLYYSRCIRDCFDTTGWPDVTTWEATLQQ